VTDVRRGERQDDERRAVGREVDRGAGVEAAIRSALHTALRDVDERHVMAELKKALSGGRTDHPGPTMTIADGVTDGRSKTCFTNSPRGLTPARVPGGRKAVRADPATGPDDVPPDGDVTRAGTGNVGECDGA
jgi:hypothetical protein